MARVLISGEVCQPNTGTRTMGDGRWAMGDGEHCTNRFSTGKRRITFFGGIEMIVEVSPGRFSVQCDLWRAWHPFVGDQSQVHEQSLEDRYIHVSVEYVAPFCAETKTFCPACAKEQFAKTFPEVINPAPHLVEWYRNN